MVAYVIGIRHKTLDQKEMESYTLAARPTLAGKAKVLSRYGLHDDVESDPIEGIALLEFPTMKEAQNWYRSPEYQKAMAHRIKGGDYTILIFDGV